MTPLSLFAFGEEAVSRAVLLGSVCRDYGQEGEEGSGLPERPDARARGGARHARPRRARLAARL